MVDKVLSHIDEEGKANMVDVSNKETTARIAVATANVIFPVAVYKHLQGQNFLGNKGSIFQTAVIAGIQAAKKTSDLIPLCHPLALKKIDVDIQPNPNTNSLQISATVKCIGQTGVEMEALTAASVAALTVYDMTKAISHDIIISDIKLKEKRGGKRDVSN
ncbi:cyclic pyranopterin monophosphate synthase subunit MoaC [Flavobacteriaceae bacterium MAR_2010_188]|nr:cyclic pyranopterin monophosphate synthase subunit MoaC [Flavobacteriaceae bacterium MAR_2010_188]